jgi:predicted RNase H-like HicB family nuclease
MNEDRALRYSARIVWSEEDGAFVATSPEFEGISALGSTASDAASELQLALQLAVETHEAEGWAVPEPFQEPRYSGQFRLRLPRSLHAWLAHRAGLEGVSLNTLVLEILSRVRGAADTADRGTERLDAAIRRLEGVAAGLEVG